MINITKDLPIKEQYDIIEKNNDHVLELLKEELKNDKIINIIGKGQSATYIKNAHAINQSLIFTNKKYIYLNDITGLYGIEQYIKDISYVFIPDYPHNPVTFNAHRNITFIDIITILKKFNFNGNIFIYQIQTTLQPNLLPKYKINVYDSGEVPIMLYSKLLNKKNFNLYGMMTKQYLGYDYSYNKDLKICYDKDFFLKYTKDIVFEDIVLSNNEKYTYKDFCLIFNKRFNPYASGQIISFNSIKPLEYGKKIILKEWNTISRSDIVRSDLNIYVH